MRDGRSPSAEPPRRSAYPWILGALVLLYAAFGLYGTYADRAHRAGFPHCERVAGSIHECAVPAETTVSRRSS